MKAQCRAIEVLPQLYGLVVIPRAVFDELSEKGAPEAVRSWLDPLPTWISIRSANAIDETLVLGRGEVEAICLAQEIHADGVLLDERRARKAALERRSLPGMIASLQSYGDDPTRFHPHLHSLVTDGLVSADGSLVPIPCPDPVCLMELFKHKPIVSE